MWRKVGKFTEKRWIITWKEKLKSDVFSKIFDFICVCGKFLVILRDFWGTECEKQKNEN
jgi:hypothetical protein